MGSCRTMALKMVAQKKFLTKLSIVTSKLKNLKPQLAAYNIFFNGRTQTKDLLTPLNALSTSFDTSRISYHRLDLSPISEKTKLAFVIENAFEKEECEALIELSESIGFSPALINTGDGQLCRNLDIRSNYRLVTYDRLFAEVLKSRLFASLPYFFNGHQLSCLNERIKFLRYNAGEKFGAHYDSIYKRPDGSEMSLLTLQMYLNDGFEGGETVFLNSETGKRMAVKPKTGSILAFQKDLLHEGSLLKAGTKYTMRTGVMYKCMPL